MKYGFIYITTNMINGKKYIGKRKYSYGWEKYLGSGVALKKAIVKYGKQNFKREIIEECSSLDELNNAEIKWISYFNAVESDCFYNLSHGGDGCLSGELHPLYGKHHKKETKDKISSKAKLRTGSKNPFYNKHHSLDTKDKIRKAQLKREKSDFERKEISKRTKGKLNPMYGKHHTEESKNKNRINHLGKKASLETRNKMSNNSKIKRKVICLNNGLVFESMIEAGKFACVKSQNIGRACIYNNRKAGRDKITGELLSWMYYDEYLKLES